MCPSTSLESPSSLTLYTSRDESRNSVGSTLIEERDRRDIRTLIGRAQQGILILDQEGEILYQNQEARQIIGTLAGKNPSSSLSTDLSLPQIVLELYAEFKQDSDSSSGPDESSNPFTIRVRCHHGAFYVFSAVLLQLQWNDPCLRHLLILIERVHQTSLMAECEKPIKLTPREKRVVQLLLEGMTNKEVAACMQIGEYTVKDHIKQIMKKFNVSTRAGIVAKSLSHRFHLTLGSDIDLARTG
jgi:DNA-binding CsgD family transcriptional regulator